MSSTYSTIETVTLSVAGMTCGSCERHIRKELDGVSGYRDARVSLAEGRVQVTYDASAASPGDLVQAVVRAGYAAEVAAGEAPTPAGVEASSGSCCAPRAL